MPRKRRRTRRDDAARRLLPHYLEQLATGSTLMKLLDGGRDWIEPIDAVWRQLYQAHRTDVYQLAADRAHLNSGDSLPWGFWKYEATAPRRSSDPVVNAFLQERWSEGPETHFSRHDLAREHLSRSHRAPTCPPADVEAVITTIESDEQRHGATA